jgi:hypothetical protein
MSSLPNWGLYLQQGRGDRLYAGVPSGPAPS